VEERALEESHLSLETIAQWMTGDLSFEDLTGRVVPHFLACCPACRARYEEIQRLKKEVGHWDERVAVSEGPRAPGLLAALLPLPFDEQVALVEDEPDYQTWGFCQILLKTSREAAFDDPLAAVNLAELAVTVAAGLGTAYDPCWVADLQARSHAGLGNARRILGELRSAETAFREAESRLRGSTGDPLIQAEILGMKGSLRRDQRRFAEALELMTRALDLYREHGDSHGMGMSSLKRAKILEESGDPQAAAVLLREAIDTIDAGAEPQLHLYARHNLASCLSLAGRYREAEGMLPELRAGLERLGRLGLPAKPLDRVRLQWIEGRIDFGVGRAAEAEAAFRHVQADFLSRGMGYDAALVSLDLAILYIEERRTAELRRLAVEIMPVFQARDVHREALATLVIFQKACEQERLTVQLATQLAASLRRDQPAPA
jgi:tetratricopeptide (TPR) repeat protein